MGKNKNSPSTFFKMFYVYFLQSLIKPDEYYVGSTNNLGERLKAHNGERNKSTKKYRPWKLVYYEAFVSEQDARNREKGLKHHGKGLQELKKRIKNSIEKAS